MKLTKRQHRFLEQAARPDGACAWDQEITVLRNEELEPIRSLVAVDETDKRVGAVWRITRDGLAELGCDCQAPPPVKSGAALVSVRCPLHGDNPRTLISVP